MTDQPGHTASYSQQGVSHTLEITVPAATMSERVDEVARSLRDRARLPGFRKGKAPLAMIRSQFAEQIRERLLDGLVPRILGRELEARSLQPVGTPELEGLEFEPGGELTFTVRFDTAPEVVVTVADLTAKRPAVELTEDMVQESLQQLRERAARLVPAGEGSTAAEGTYARCRIVLLPKDGKGKKLAEETRYVAVGQEKPIPGLNAQLPGMAVGEEREFATRLADAYPNDLLAGKDVRCRVEALELKRHQLPDLDDDLAKELGFASLEAMRLEVRADLERALGAEADRAVVDQLLDQLRAANPVEVPRTLVERRLDEMARQLATDLARQGVDPREAVDWAALRADRRTAAEASVAEELLLDRVAQDAGIEVDDEALQAEIRRQVEIHEGGNPRPLASVLQQMRKDGSYETMRRNLRRRSALEHLKARATIEHESGDSAGAEKAAK